MGETPPPAPASSSPGALARFLQTDKVPVTRREALMYGFLGFCLLHNPDMAAAMMGLVAGAAAMATAIVSSLSR